MRDIEELNLKQKIENIRGQIKQKYTFFHENIMKVIDKNAPLKKLTKEELKRSKIPWITKGILTSIKKKYILLKKFIKSNDQLTFLRYKTYREKINHLIRKCKKKYYTDFFQKAAQDMKKWKQVNSIIHKGKHKDVIICIKTAKGFDSDPHRTANCFTLQVLQKLSFKNQNQT